MYRGKDGLSVLIVSASVKAEDYLRDILSGGSFAPVASAKSVSEAKRMQLENQYDIVIINTPLPDDFGIEFAEQLCEDSSVGVLLFVKNELFEQVSCKVEDYGVLTFSRPGSRQSITQAVRLIAATHNRLAAFERKAVKLEAKMKEIRLINRAKWLLIRELKLEEPEAHRYIEKQAMDRCISKRIVAEEIIKTYS